MSTRYIKPSRSKRALCHVTMQGGCSSLGVPLAVNARGIGIDTRRLHISWKIFESFCNITIINLRKFVKIRKHYLILVQKEECILLQSNCRKANIISPSKHSCWLQLCMMKTWSQTKGKALVIVLIDIQEVVYMKVDYHGGRSLIEALV